MEAQAPIKRLTDWPSRLDVYLSAQSESSFIWGKNDCVLFALGALDAMTGANTSRHFRGRYSTELSASKLIRKIAGSGLGEAVELCATRWGLVRHGNSSFAQRGDLVLMDTMLGETLGIISLNGRWAVTIGLDGMKSAPLGAVLVAWKI